MLSSRCPFTSKECTSWGAGTRNWRICQLPLMTQILWKMNKNHECGQMWKLISWKTSTGKTKDLEILLLEFVLFGFSIVIISKSSLVYLYIELVQSSSSRRWSSRVEEWDFQNERASSHKSEKKQSLDLTSLVSWFAYHGVYHWVCDSIDSCRQRLVENIVEPHFVEANIAQT